MTGFLGTEASVYSDFGLVLEIVTTALFTLGYFYEKRRGKHCFIMVAAVATNTIFVISYMVSRMVREIIPIPPVHLDALYRGLVIPHGILSTLVLILVILQALLAYKWRTKHDNLMRLEGRRPAHRKLGLASLILWYVSFLSGVMVYAILYIL